MYQNSSILGFVNKARKQTETKKAKLEKTLENWKARRERDRKRYDEAEKRLGVAKMVNSQELKDLEECNANIERLNKEIEGLDNMLKTGEFENLGMSYHNDPYTPSEDGFSLGNINGRSFIGPNLERVPMDKDDVTYIASEYKEGEIPETKIEDLLTMVKANEEDSILFDSDIFYGPALMDDDTGTIEKALAHAHDVGMINAENKKVFKMLREAKAPISVVASKVHVAINNNLSAKSKLNAVIVVNSDGFSKLDMDSDGGYPLIKRVGDKFIYHDKFEIQEVANEVLPNNEDGKSPIIVMDPHIVKFYVMRDDNLAKDDFMKFKVHDRRLKREIIALTTTSDSAYIHGTLA